MTQHVIYIIYISCLKCFESDFNILAYAEAISGKCQACKIIKCYQITKEICSRFCQPKSCKTQTCHIYCHCHRNCVIVSICATYYFVLHYITLHYITLHYIALHCIVSQCSAVQCSAVQCSAVQCIVSYRIVSYRIVSYRIVSYRIGSDRIRFDYILRFKIIYAGRYVSLFRL